MLSRIRLLQEKMQQQSIDFAIIMHPRDVYYYAGTAQPCNLLIGKEGDPCLQVRRAWDYVVEETTLPLSCLTDKDGMSVVKEIINNASFEVKTIGLNTDVIPAKLF